MFASAGFDMPLGDVADECRPSSCSAQENFAHTRSAPPKVPAQPRPCATGKMPRRRSVPASRDRRSAGRETSRRTSSSSEESVSAGSGLNAVRRAKSVLKSGASQVLAQARDGDSAMLDVSTRILAGRDGKAD